MSGAVRITAHWRERVAQRIGPHVCPDSLARGIWQAIDAQRGDLVAYVGRVRRDGTRAFRFRLKDGRYFVALVNAESRAMVTVLSDGVLKLSRGEEVHTAPQELVALPPPAPWWRRQGRRRVP